jgi:hypothetical protein
MHSRAAHCLNSALHNKVNQNIALQNQRYSLNWPDSKYEYRSATGSFTLS